MKIGQKSEKNRTIPRSQGNEIDERFFKIEFKINGKVFKKAVDGLLSFESENLDEVSDSELDHALDQVSYWRYTFLAAAAEIEMKLAQIEREFNSWYAAATQNARLVIIEERKTLKEVSKVPNNWFGSITKNELEDYIISAPDYREKYHEYQNTIGELKKNQKLLFGLNDILQSRGGHLQSISKRRIENMKQRFNA